MLILNGKVKLSQDELDLMMNEAGCKIAPETVDDFNAWVDEIKYTDPTPDERLFNAVMEEMRIVNGMQKCSILAALSSVHWARAISTGETDNK